MQTVNTKPYILYIGNIMLPDKNAACLRVLNNKNLFNSIGFEVDIIGNANEEIESIGSHGFNVDFDKNGYLKSYLKILLYILSNWTRYKHFIFYNYPVLINIVLIFFKPISYNKKIILDITEWYESRLSWNPKTWIKSYDIWLRNFLLWRLNKRLIVTSGYYDDRYPSSQKRLNLPTLQELCVNQSVQSQKNILSKTKLIYFGSPFDFSSGKKVEKEQMKVLIQSVINCPDVELDIFGIDYDQYCKFYEEGPTSSRIKFNGRIPHSELVNILPNYDASIFFRENTRVNLVGFPSKLSLSISYGIPVITSDIKSLRVLKTIPGIILLDSSKGKIPDLNNVIIELSEMQGKDFIKRDQFHWHAYKERAINFFN